MSYPFRIGIKRLRYALEAVAAWLGFTVFRVLPLDAASALGGWLGRCVGPRLKVHAIARRNLASALPELSAARQGEVLTGMWDNLGRTLAEFAHIPTAHWEPRMQRSGLEHLEALRAPLPSPAHGAAAGGAALLVSAHYGNWELTARASQLVGLPVTLVYRHANNPWVDGLINRIRRGYTRALHAKGPGAAMQVVRALRRGQCVGMLVDQKMNTGMAVPFFGRPAMTATAVAELALKYDVPIIPAYVRRTGGARFHVQVEPPLTFPRSGNRDADTLACLSALHTRLEAWIRAHPEQWFWVHRRWPEDMPKDTLKE